MSTNDEITAFLPFLSLLLTIYSLLTPQLTDLQKQIIALFLLSRFVSYSILSHRFVSHCFVSYGILSYRSDELERVKITKCPELEQKQ